MFVFCLVNRLLDRQDFNNEDLLAVRSVTP